jgi:hypothetical protein
MRDVQTEANPEHSIVVNMIVPPDATTCPLLSRRCVSSYPGDVIASLTTRVSCDAVQDNTAARRR